MKLIYKKAIKQLSDWAGYNELASITLTFKNSKGRKASVTYPRYRIKDFSIDVTNDLDEEKIRRSLAK